MKQTVLLPTRRSERREDFGKLGKVQRVVLRSPQCAGRMYRYYPDRGIGDRAMNRGLDIDSFRPRVAILVNCRMGLYEEIAKSRAVATRAWVSSRAPTRPPAGQ